MFHSWDLSLSQPLGLEAAVGEATCLWLPWLQLDFQVFICIFFPRVKIWVLLYYRLPLLTMLEPERASAKHSDSSFRSPRTALLLLRAMGYLAAQHHATNIY